MVNEAPVTHRPKSTTTCSQGKEKKNTKAQCKTAACQKQQHCTLSSWVGSNQCIQHLLFFLLQLHLFRCQEFLKSQHFSKLRRKQELHHTDIKWWQWSWKQSPVSCAGFTGSAAKQCDRCWMWHPPHSTQNELGNGSWWADLELCSVCLSWGKWHLLPPQPAII